MHNKFSCHLSSIIRADCCFRFRGTPSIHLHNTSSIDKNIADASFLFFPSALPLCVVLAHASPLCNDTAAYPFNVYKSHSNVYESTISTSSAHVYSTICTFSAHASFNDRAFTVLPLLKPPVLAPPLFTHPLALCTPSLKLPVDFPLFSILVITSHMSAVNVFPVLKSGFFFAR